MIETTAQTPPSPKRMPVSGQMVLALSAVVDYSNVGMKPISVDLSGYLFMTFRVGGGGKNEIRLAL